MRLAFSLFQSPNQGVLLEHPSAESCGVRRVRPRGRPNGGHTLPRFGRFKGEPLELKPQALFRWRTAALQERPDAPHHALRFQNLRPQFASPALKRRNDLVQKPVEQLECGPALWIEEAVRMVDDRVVHPGLCDVDVVEDIPERH
jgi:hypothetical protein